MHKDWDIYFWHAKSSKGYFMDEDGNVLYTEYQPLDFSDYEAMKANYMDGLAFWLRTQLEGAANGGKE